MLKQEILFLFDLDNTLTPTRETMDQDMKDTLKDLRRFARLAIVSGSDFEKIKEQINDYELLQEFEYIFSENGAVCRKKLQLIEAIDIGRFLGQERLNIFLEYAHELVHECDCPIRRNNFVELRGGTINISPMGRECSSDDRKWFTKYDEMTQVRKYLIKKLQERFNDWPLQFTIAGEISIDICKEGQDKSNCLKHLEEYREIFFYGDQVFDGGNDYQLFHSERVKGTRVYGPTHTLSLLKAYIKTCNI